MSSAYSIIFIGELLIVSIYRDIGDSGHILHFHIGLSVVFIGSQVDDIRYAVVF